MPSISPEFLPPSRLGLGLPSHSSREGLKWLRGIVVVPEAPQETLSETHLRSEDFRAFKLPKIMHKENEDKCLAYLACSNVALRSLTVALGPPNRAAFSMAFKSSSLGACTLENVWGDGGGVLHQNHAETIFVLPQKVGVFHGSLTRSGNILRLFVFHTWFLLLETMKVWGKIPTSMGTGYFEPPSRIL